MNRFLIPTLVSIGALAWSCLALAQGPSTNAESAAASELGIGYHTVAEALDALKAKPGTTLTTTKPDSWVIVAEAGGRSIWSFTPPTHYAYPAVVRRQIKVRQNGERSSRSDLKHNPVIQRSAFVSVAVKVSVRSFR